jgi:hypothetical protein
MFLVDNIDPQMFCSRMERVGLKETTQYEYILNNWGLYKKHKKS